MLVRLLYHAPTSILDVGCGAGTYSDLVRGAGMTAELIGIEVWEPYIERFGLATRYDHLIVADVRGLDPLPPADVVILGDVLEHMTEQDAVTVWERARRTARKAVFLSVPIMHYPQGAEEGNPFEEHIVDDYTHDRVLATFSGVTAHWVGTIVGVYEAAR
jgi:SAM-dependent methyltransferase